MVPTSDQISASLLYGDSAPRSTQSAGKGVASCLCDGDSGRAAMYVRCRYDWRVASVRSVNRRRIFQRQNSAPLARTSLNHRGSRQNPPHTPSRGSRQECGVICSADAPFGAGQSAVSPYLCGFSGVKLRIGHAQSRQFEVSMPSRRYLGRARLV